MSDARHQAADAREGREPLTEDQIRGVVERLARRRSGGGQVIERAAILAEGSSSAAILAWIADHAWEPEELPPAPGRGGSGLYGNRDGEPRRAPRRYVRRPDVPG